MEKWHSHRASRYNAWRLPSNKVKHRYQQQGYTWLDTPHQGQLTVNFSAQGWRISSLREQILPRWYHQWFGVPVDNGRICGYFNKCWFFECITTKISTRAFRRLWPTIAPFKAGLFSWRA
ncbi:hypothetical protein ACLB1Q_10245 [Escherichia coli]